MVIHIKIIHCAKIAIHIETAKFQYGIFLPDSLTSPVTAPHYALHKKYNVPQSPGPPPAIGYGPASATGREPAFYSFYFAE